jgi:hypothetical protein
VLGNGKRFTATVNVLHELASGNLTIHTEVAEVIKLRDTLKSFCSLITMLSAGQPVDLWDVGNLDGVYAETYEAVKEGLRKAREHDGVKRKNVCADCKHCRREGVNYFCKVSENAVDLKYECNNGRFEALRN